MTTKEMNSCRFTSSKDWLQPKRERASVISWTNGVQLHERSTTAGWLPLRGELSHVAAAIESAWQLVDLTDEDGNALVTREALTRAARILHSCARHAWRAYGFKVAAPAIQPGPDQSVDLHWFSKNAETLVNIPADPALPVEYYGDDREGNSVKGQLNTGEFGGLVLWLTTKK